MQRFVLLSTAKYVTKEALVSDLAECGISVLDADVRAVPSSRTQSGRAYDWVGALPVGSREATALHRPCVSRGVKEPVLGYRIDYSMQEKTDARVLILDAPGFDVRGDTGPDDGQEYDYTNACPTCTAGAQLIPPFRMRRADLPDTRNLALTHRLDIVVSGALGDALSAIPDSDRWLFPVEDAKSHASLPWLALQPACVLPRIHPSSQGLSRDPKARYSCPACTRSNFGRPFMIPTELVYSASEIAEQCGACVPDGQPVPDVSGSWECTGPGYKGGINKAGSRYGGRVPSPLMLFSQRVAQVFLKHAKKYIRLTPVALID